VKDSKVNNGKYIVPAVEQASRLLFCMAKSKKRHMSLNDICAAVGIHKSKAYSILVTLQQYNLIKKNAGGSGFSLGPGLISLSRKVLDDLDITAIAAPMLEILAKKAEATATLGFITDDDRVFVIAKHEGAPDVGISVRVGHQFPLTMGCHGKAIAAFLSKEELKALLKRNSLYFHGKAKRFNKDRLIEELEECRRDGFAMDLGEVNPGINAVSAPVLGPGGRPISYIALLGLFSTEKARAFGPVVAETGRKLSQKMGFYLIDDDQYVKDS
jgi:DNA-binding IclR family transcriptional regulator